MTPQEVTALLNRTIANGRLVEGGWQALRIAVLEDGTSPQQLADMRMAFFAGASHLFSAIMACLDKGPDVTDEDLARMSAIHDELASFATELQLRILPTQGNA